MKKSVNPTFLSQLRALIPKGQPIKYQTGQVLFYEGHIPYGVFLILSGTIHISSQQEDCEDTPLLQCPEGTIYGLDALLQKKALCCTATAQTPCETVFISKNLFEPFIKQMKSNLN